MVFIPSQTELATMKDKDSARLAMRKEFESRAAEWCRELYGLQRTDNGSYLDLYLELRWQGWQAAREPHR